MTFSFIKNWAAVSAIALSLTGMVGCGDDATNDTADSGVIADSSTADAATSEDAAADAAVLPSLVEIAAGNPDFSMLVAAATRAELVTTLSTGEFTIFAPTNAAFTASGITMEMLENMPLPQLTGILTYHALPGTVLAEDLEAGPATSVAMLSLIVGTEGGATLNGGNTVVGGANVVMTDILARNGAVHIIDRVLLPPTVADLARYAGLSDLSDALVATELDDDLAGTGPFTVFAPTNAAFEAISDDLAELDAEDVANILMFHVLDPETYTTALYSNAFPATATSFDTINGNAFTLDATTTPATYGGVDIILTDIVARNGVVHVIDEVVVVR